MTCRMSRVGEQGMGITGRENISHTLRPHHMTDRACCVLSASVCVWWGRGQGRQHLAEHDNVLGRLQQAEPAVQGSAHADTRGAVSDGP